MIFDRSERRLLQLGPQPKDAAGRGRSYLPPHLTEILWLDYESQQAFSALSALEKDLQSIESATGKEAVHKARVGLRKWDAAWDVLREDGWETAEYAERIGNKLKKLHKALGTLRDWDVNLDVAKGFNVPPKLMSKWKEERREAKKEVTKRLKKFDMGKLLRDMRKYLEEREENLRERLVQSVSAYQSAYDRLDPYLIAQENRTRNLERTARTSEELHQLRLSIKRWRYLLTEFFDLTNLQLVQSQQVLGKINDIDRVFELLKEEAKTQGKKGKKDRDGKDGKGKDAKGKEGKDGKGKDDKDKAKATKGKVSASGKKAKTLTGSDKAAINKNPQIKRVMKRMATDRKLQLRTFGTLRKTLPFGLRPAITSYGP